MLEAPFSPRGSRRTMHSTITSVPSTIMPKSSAPRLSRLACTPPKYMHAKANSRLSGMVMAVNTAARKLPRKNTSTTKTIAKASSNVLETVPSVVETSSVRS